MKKLKINNSYLQILKIIFLALILGCSNSEDGPSVISPPVVTVDDYTVPVQDNDGWNVGALTIEDSKKALLLKGTLKIKNNAFGEIHSIVIAHNDKLVLEKYYPGRNSNGQFINFNRFTKHEVQSASKSFRSALIGIAIEKGFIEHVNAKLFSFFPEHQNLNIGGKDQITLEHMLTMSSGLQWNEWSGNSLNTMYSQPYSEWLPYVLSRPLEYEPGSTFVYNTGASIGLNNIIVNAISHSSSALGFNDFVKTYYADLVESDELPGVGAPLGASTTPRDMAKFGSVFLNDGTWKNNQIISKDWIEKSIKKRFQVNSEMSYGYQWWMRTLKSSSTNYDIFYANGNGGQFIIIIKDLNLVVVSTGGKFGTAGDEIFNFIEQYVLPSFES